MLAFSNVMVFHGCKQEYLVFCNYVHIPFQLSVAWNGNLSSHEKPRKLKWTLSGWGVVEYHGCLYKVSTAQLLVLLQFNSVDVSGVDLCTMCLRLFCS